MNTPSLVPFFSRKPELMFVNPLSVSSMLAPALPPLFRHTWHRDLSAPHVESQRTQQSPGSLTGG
jgi:hypothetical protein